MGPRRADPPPRSGCFCPAGLPVQCGLRPLPRLQEGLIHACPDLAGPRARAGPPVRALASLPHQPHRQGLLQPENVGPVFQMPGTFCYTCRSAAPPRPSAASQDPLPPRFTGAAQGKEGALCTDLQVPPHTRVMRPESCAQTRSWTWACRPRGVCCVQTRLASPAGAPPPEPAARLRAPCPRPAALGQERPPGSPWVFRIPCLPSALEASLVP